MILYKIVYIFCHFMLKVLFNFKISGRENIPSDKNFILVSNHTSNFDPPILGVATGIRLAFMAKEELFKNKIFGGFIKRLGAFPVSRGGGDISAIKTSLRILKDGQNMVIFPEGGRSRTKGMLRKGKSGAALIATKAKVGILPLGINANFRFRGKVTVTIGEYIDLSEYFDEKLSADKLQEITDNIIMPEIANLAGVKVYENKNC